MKKTCLAKIIKSFLLFFVFFIFSQNIVKAQDFLSFTATPVRLGDDYSISLKPGDKKQVQVKIRNGSLGTVDLETAAVDFIIGENGSTPVAVDLEDSSNRWSLASWLTLAPAMHTLASKEVAVVNVLIEVPEDALPGGHYAMVYHRPVDSNTEEISGSGVSQRIGTLLYVLVEGDINEEAYITNFDWPKFQETGPTDFSLSVDNQSDIHIKTKPVVKIYNIFGKEVANLEVDSKNIFPMSTRSFFGKWDKIWGIGPYKAVVEVMYGSQGQVANAEAVMWMFPIKIFLLLMIFILLLLILVLSITKHKKAVVSPTNIEKEISEQILEKDKGVATEDPQDAEKKQ